MSKYKEISLIPGETIDEAVEELVRYRDRGEYALVRFNGVVLYSDTVTLDAAYESITGMTRDRFKEFMRDYSKGKRRIGD